MVHVHVIKVAHKVEVVCLCLPSVACLGFKPLCGRYKEYTGACF